MMVADWPAARRTWAGIVLFGMASVLLIPALILALNIRYDYTLRVVMLGAGILGVVSGVLGSFAVLRKQSLLGDTLSHAALPGVAIAFLLAGRELGWLLIGAGITGWLATMFVQAVIRTTRLKQDAAMGIALSVGFGVGMALLGYIQGREDASRAGLNTFIFGQAAAISQAEVQLIGLVTLAVLAVVALFWKSFKLITFDSEFASTNGYPVQVLDMLLATLIVVAIVLGLQLAGVILMVGMLIAPAVAARQWTTHLGQMVVLAALFGAVSGIVGALISASRTGLPTGPLIIVVATLIVALSILLAPERGLAWKWWQQRRNRRAFVSEQLLQDIYELARSHANDAYRVPEGMLTGLHGNVAQKGLKKLQAQGLVRQTNGRWQLTEAGLAQAQTMADNRRLWALYRMHREALGLPVVAEDRRRPIQEVLGPEAVAQLEVLAAQQDKEEDASS